MNLELKKKIETEQRCMCSVHETYSLFCTHHVGRVRCLRGVIQVCESISLRYMYVIIRPVFRLATKPLSEKLYS